MKNTLYDINFTNGYCYRDRRQSTYTSRMREKRRKAGIEWDRHWRQSRCSCWTPDSWWWCRSSPIFWVRLKAISDDVYTQSLQQMSNTNLQIIAVLVVWRKRTSFIFELNEQLIGELTARLGHNACGAICLPNFSTIEVIVAFDAAALEACLQLIPHETHSVSVLSAWSVLFDRCLEETFRLVFGLRCAKDRKINWI